VHISLDDAVRAPLARLTGRIAPGRVDHSVWGIAVPSQATSRLRQVGESSTAKLAKFFSDASPLRIPIRLTRVGSEDQAGSESTVIEYGTPREVLFASALPLQFADTVRLQNSDGTLDAEASVVALQYAGGRITVAARFTKEVANWIVKS
jgi:hypothetical protein